MISYTFTLWQFHHSLFLRLLHAAFILPSKPIFQPRLNGLTQVDSIAFFYLTGGNRYLFTLCIEHLSLLRTLWAHGRYVIWIKMIFQLLTYDLSQLQRNKLIIENEGMHGYIGFRSWRSIFVRAHCKNHFGFWSSNC